MKQRESSNIAIAKHIAVGIIIAAIPSCHEYLQQDKLGHALLAIMGACAVGVIISVSFALIDETPAVLRVRLDRPGATHRMVRLLRARAIEAAQRQKHIP
jgi:hypothetical protein